MASETLDQMYSGPDLSAIATMIAPAGRFWTRARCEMTFTNPSNHPIMVRIYKFHMRRDLPATTSMQPLIVASATSQGLAAAPFVQGFSPWDIFAVPHVAKIKEFASFRLTGGETRDVMYEDKQIRSWNSLVDSSLFYYTVKGATLFYVNVWMPTAANTTTREPFIPNDPVINYSSVVTYDIRTPNPDTPLINAVTPATGANVNTSSNVEQFTTGALIPGIPE
jgi:hypothetical protein